MHATLPLLARTDFPPLRRAALHTLQVNLGYKCNQSCLHCHVNAGPQRTEMMDADTAALVLQVLRVRHVATLDLTGGAPELNPHFRDLVRGARALGVTTIDRCNLSILSEPGQQDLAAFLADQARGSGGLAALLLDGQCRPPAWRRCVRAQHRGAACAECAGLWAGRQRPDA